MNVSKSIYFLLFYVISLYQINKYSFFKLLFIYLLEIKHTIVLDRIHKSHVGDDWHICGTCPWFTTCVHCGVWECIGLIREMVKGGNKR